MIEYQKWDRAKYRGGDGVLTGADQTQEWLLPWWWDQYQKNNSYPVTWIDLGLTPPMKEWCRQRGELIEIRVIPELFVVPKEEIDPQLIALWENISGVAYWACRNAWFTKPFGLTQTPYERTIWLDCDCETRGNVASLFDLCDPEGIALKFMKNPQIIPIIYCSGVMVYRWGHPAIATFAEKSVTENGKYFADDHILSTILVEEKYPVKPLPLYYHTIWNEENEDALIYHYMTSNGKRLIKGKMIAKQLEDLLK